MRSRAQGFGWEFELTNSKYFYYFDKTKDEGEHNT